MEDKAVIKGSTQIEGWESKRKQLLKWIKEEPNLAKVSAIHAFAEAYLIKNKEGSK